MEDFREHEELRLKVLAEALRQCERDDILQRERGAFCRAFAQAAAYRAERGGPEPSMEDGGLRMNETLLGIHARVLRRYMKKEPDPAEREGFLFEVGRSFLRSHYRDYHNIVY